MCSLIKAGFNMSLKMENTEWEFVKTVSPFLKNGIGALNDLSISLLNLDVQFVAKDDYRFGKIRSVIVEAQQNLQRAELAASSQLDEVDTSYIQLTTERGNLNTQHKNKSLKLQDLKNQQKTNKSMLDMYKMSLESAIENFITMRQALWDLEMRKRKAEEQINIGIGITFIPIIGWIAGPIIMAVAGNDIDQVNYKLNEAENLIQEFEARVCEYSWKVSACGRTIEDTRTEISRAQWELDHIAKSINDILIKKKEIADFQAKARNSVKLIGSFVGIANVAELQTRLFVLLEAMRKLLQNFLKLAEHIRDDRLLYDERMKCVIANMQVQYVKLQAVSISTDIAATEQFF